MVPGVGVRVGNVMHLSWGIWRTEGNGARGRSGGLWRMRDGVGCDRGGARVLKVMLGRKWGLGIRVDVLEDGVVKGGRRLIIFLVKRGLIVLIIVWDVTSVGGLILLGSYLLCCEEAATGTAGTTHCVFVATFM